MPRLNIFSFPILGEDFTGGIDDKTSGDSDDPNLKDVPKITDTTKVMPLKIKRGQISGSITTPSPILQSGIDDETSADSDYTMTVDAAPVSEHCEEPPTQVVRANPAQLVVTDKQGGQNPAGQLQLPQKPHPPGLPKPVPGKVNNHIHTEMYQNTREMNQFDGYLIFFLYVPFTDFFIFFAWTFQFFDLHIYNDYRERTLGKQNTIIQI